MNGENAVTLTYWSYENGCVRRAILFANVPTLRPLPSTRLNLSFIVLRPVAVASDRTNQFLTDFSWSTTAISRLLCSEAFSYQARDPTAI
jgi:hypothetical protein